MPVRRSEIFMVESLSSIADSLEEHLRKLQDERDTALQTVDHIEAEVQKIESAIRMLLGEQRPRAKPGRKKQGITGPQVTALVERVLHEEGPLGEPEVKARVLERASNEGKSGKGLTSFSARS